MDIIIAVVVFMVIWYGATVWMPLMAMAVRSIFARK